MLPILHLNAYKVSGPTVDGCAPDEERKHFYEGRSDRPHFVEGDDPTTMH